MAVPRSHQAVSVSSRWSTSASRASWRTRSPNTPRESQPRGLCRRCMRPPQPGGSGGTLTTSTGRSGGGSSLAAPSWRAASAVTSSPCPCSPRRRPMAQRPGAPPSGSGGWASTTRTRIGQRRRQSERTGTLYTTAATAFAVSPARGRPTAYRPPPPDPAAARRRPPRASSRRPGTVSARPARAG